MTTVLEGNLVLPDRIHYGQLVIASGRIKAVHIQPSDYIDGAEVLPVDHLIAPGFIDIQINGSFGKEFKTDTDALSHVARELVRFGTTAFCPTITTRDLTTYHSHSSRLWSAHTDMGYARVLGFHFEGPALNPEKVGAQNPALLRTPEELLDTEYLKCDHLRLVTIAPELPGSARLIDRLRGMDIRMGIGHTKISYDALQKIYDSRNMVIVHLFNAMDPLTAREPGVVGFALAESESWLSIIVDGVHLHTATAHTIWNAKRNKRKVICVSDGSAVAGLAPGTYQVGERTITRHEDRATLPNGTLVGSVLTLDVAVRNLIKTIGATPHEAICTVTRNPATFLGIERDVGQIAEGCHGDVTVLDGEYCVRRTFIGGIERYKTAPQLVRAIP